MKLPAHPVGGVSVGRSSLRAMDVAEQAAIALEEVCGALPGGGERRPGQEAMVRRVAESIEAGTHLVVRAGTGTGKSLAYLVPALLSGRTTVVATATKALQDQLATKDLPFLAEHLRTRLGRTFTFSVLKGRANYVCRQRLTELAAVGDGQQQLDGLADAADAGQLATIAEWADSTETGDRADLPIQPTATTWAAVSVGSHECPGAARCPSGGECFAEAARATAEAVDLVVTNLHLYGIDVVTEGAALPFHEVAILDEAHQTEDVLAHASGFELRAGRFIALVQRARSILAGSTAVENVADLAGRLSLQVAPVDVATVLDQCLWGERTVVLTSATIPANLSTRLGLTDHQHRIEDVGSPFDFERQSLLYCATSMPDPSDDGYRAACYDEIERLVTAAGGRTLALFTSRRALDEAVDALRDRFPWQVLHQEDLPKPLLLAKFADDETSCLFGTKGLWHGIDIPGPSLSLVVIDRIPFPRPNDPLLSARRDLLGEGAWREIDLPLAATELAQGAGRLIRTTEDRGVVAVLDRRLATSRSYRWDLLEALPPMARTADPDEVVSFLEGL